MYLLPLPRSGIRSGKTIFAILRSGVVARTDRLRGNDAARDGLSDLSGSADDNDALFHGALS
jgi:hypothetical protein